MAKGGIALKDRIIELRRVKAQSLLPHPRNWRRHPAAQANALRGLLDEIGFAGALLTRETPEGLMLIDGHLRQDTVDGNQELPVLVTDLNEEEADKLLLTYDPLGMMAIGDFDAINRLLETVKSDNPAVNDLLSRIGNMPAVTMAPAGAPSFVERFGVPPFSVLDARQGYWRDRKAMWAARGIKEKAVLGTNLLRWSDRVVRAFAVSNQRQMTAVFHQPSDLAEGESEAQRVAEDGSADGQATGFDPVMCELAYRWFCPPDGLILDPFAGGNTRGVMAGLLGRRYIGVDIRPDQVELNRSEAAKLIAGDAVQWIAADSLRICEVARGDYDFIFSCPPYAGIEHYSDLPGDISRMGYAEFIAVYRKIVAAACSMLKADRFACFVVGDARDKRGNYYNFVSDTIAAFRSAGLELYNEAILVMPIGSLTMRAGRMFEHSRKLGKLHQNVLVFLKGDALKATEAIGEVEFGEMRIEESLAEA